MEDFKGTKGEWILETVKDDVSGEVSEIYITQEGGGCIVCINDGEDAYDIPTDLANAKLIAAAPELLHALQKVYRLAKQIGLAEDLDFEEYDYMEAAIKKALGH